VAHRRGNIATNSPLENRQVGPPDGDNALAVRTNREVVGYSEIAGKHDTPFDYYHCCCWLLLLLLLLLLLVR